LVDVDEMRHVLSETANICDYQPLSGITGVHTDSKGEVGSEFSRFEHITKDDEDDDGEGHHDRR